MFVAFDYFLIALIFIICLGGSWLSFKVHNDGYPFYLTTISGILTTLIWMYIVKYSRASLFLMSFYIDSVAALGYFVGLCLLGEPLTLLKVLGVAFLFVGMYLIS